MATKVAGAELASTSIGGGSLPQTSRRAPPNTSSAPSTGAGVVTSTPSSDVEITSTATQLATLEQSLLAQPIADPARVAATSETIANGSYSVQPDRIARGLVNSEQALARLFAAKG